MDLRRAFLRTALAATVPGTLLAGCGGHQAASPPPPPTRASPPAERPATCPLTGTPPPPGGVPARPALAVKVENLPSARPQYGLSRADVVLEEPVEGGITRFVVIYQCHDAERIEPIRSARIVDPDLVRQFGSHPLFAYAGGIPAAVAAVHASPLIDVGTTKAPSVYRRDPSRRAPHNLVSSTTELYAAGRRDGAESAAPPPVFSFGPLPAGARPAARVHVAYAASNLTWAWQAASGTWSRAYADTGPATLGEGGTITARNVVVMRVVMYTSPYIEDPTGAHENVFDLTGSGPVEVLRDGAVIDGTWARASLAERTQLRDGAGTTIPLSPGTTWVELVPTTVPVTVGS